MENIFSNDTGAGGCSWGMLSEALLKKPGRVQNENVWASKDK